MRRGGTVGPLVEKGENDNNSPTCGIRGCSKSHTRISTLPLKLVLTPVATGVLATALGELGLGTVEVAAGGAGDTGQWQRPCVGTVG